MWLKEEIRKTKDSGLPNLTRLDPRQTRVPSPLWKDLYSLVKNDPVVYSELCFCAVVLFLTSSESFLHPGVDRSLRETENLLPLLHLKVEVEEGFYRPPVCPGSETFRNPSET